MATHDPTIGIRARNSWDRVGGASTLGRDCWDTILLPVTALKTSLFGTMLRSIKDLSLSPLTPIGFRWNGNSRSDICIHSIDCDGYTVVCTEGVVSDTCILFCFRSLG